MEIYLFGPPRLTVADRQVIIRRRKAVALLTYLALAAGPVSRDVLAALLWPESGTARADLRRRLADLRRVLGSDSLQADRQVVALPADASIWVDVRAFARLTADGNDLAQLAQGVDLVQADFLAGFSLDDALAFDDWQRFQAEALRQQLLGALARLTWGYWERAEPARALPYAQRWGALNPLSEPAQQAQLRLFIATGQVEAARRSFTAFSQRLVTELGVTPSVETRALAATVAASGQAPVRRPEPAGTHVSLPHNLPQPSTPLIGRAAELAQVTRLLTAFEARLVTLVGLGGVGKTRLAVAVAQGLVDLARPDIFADGVFFVSLADGSPGATLSQRIAHSVGFRFHEGEAPAGQLRAYLRDKALLLLLDNCESLLLLPNSAVHLATLADLLAAAPRLAVLATGRDRLQLQGERVIEVNGLPPDPTTDAVGPALALLLAAARRHAPEFQLTAANRPALGRICALVAGLPLALELAAAWLPLLDPAVVADALGENLDFLETVWHDVPDRQRSLRAVLDTTWSLLPPAEQSVLKQLALFASSFTPAAAQVVAECPPHHLLRLRQKALVQRRQDGRLALHPLLRHFCAEQLAEVPAAAAAGAARHAHFYLNLLADAGRRLRGPDQGEALRTLVADFDNVHHAWQWACTVGDLATLAPTLDALWHFSHIQVRHGGAYALFSAAIRADGAHPALRARLLAFRAYFAGVAGDMAALQAALAAARAYLETNPVQTQMGLSLAALGLTVGLTGDIERAEAWCRQALAGANTAGTLDARWLVATIRSLLGSLAWMTGASAAGQEHLAVAAAQFQAIGDTWGLAHVLHLRGEAAYQAGAWAEADALFQAAMTQAGLLSDQYKQAQIANRLGQLARRAGDLAAAERQHRQALRLAQGLGARQPAGWAHLGLGRLAADQRANEAARRHLAAALRPDSVETGMMPQLALAALLALVAVDLMPPDLVAVALGTVVEHPGAEPGMIAQARRLAQERGLAVTPAADIAVLARRVTAALD